MRLLPGPETRSAVIRHPFFLAGLAVVVLLGLTAAGLVVFDSVRGTSGATPSVQVDPLDTTATAAPAAKTAQASGVTAKAKVATSVRTAPGRTTPIFGTVPRGTQLDVDGRTTDAKWLRVIYPPRSDQHGWVAATDVEVTGDPMTLREATAEPPVIIDLPTRAPITVSPQDDETPTPEGSPTGTVTGTPGAGELPDLVVGTTPVVTGGKLFVTVANFGKGDAKGDLDIILFNLDRTKVLGGVTLPSFSLASGKAVDIATGYPVLENQTILIVVDPNGTIDESDNTNNSVSIAVTVGEPATPTAEAPFVTPEPPTTPAP